MSQSQIHLIRQSGTLRVTFGVSPDAENVYKTLQEATPEQLELLSVVNCRNIRSAVRVLELLHERYRGYQHGAWYNLSAGELSSMLFWFQAMRAAVSTARAHFYQQLGGFPKKQHARTKLMRAVDWLQAHDPELRLSCREIGQRAGVSHGTAHNAVRYLLALNEAG